MKSAEDIESLLLRGGHAYEQPGPGIWLVKVDGAENLVLSIAGPVLAFRMKVMDLPEGKGEDLYRMLLTLNTTDLVHCAFGLEGKAVVLVHALELENLDSNEFSAVIDDMTMALSKHYESLSKFRHAA